MGWACDGGKRTRTCSVPHRTTARDSSERFPATCPVRHGKGNSVCRAWWQGLFLPTASCRACLCDNLGEVVEGKDCFFHSRTRLFCKTWRKGRQWYIREFLHDTSLQNNSQITLPSHKWRVKLLGKQCKTGGYKLPDACRLFRDYPNFALNPRDSIWNFIYPLEKLSRYYT